MNAPLVSVEVIFAAEAFRTITAFGIAVEGLAMPDFVLANSCKSKSFYRL